MCAQQTVENSTGQDSCLVKDTPQDTLFHMSKWRPITEHIEKQKCSRQELKKLWHRFPLFNHSVRKEVIVETDCIGCFPVIFERAFAFKYNSNSGNVMTADHCRSSEGI
jgi:hypothetical protein